MSSIGPRYKDFCTEFFKSIEIFEKSLDAMPNPELKSQAIKSLQEFKTKINFEDLKTARDVFYFSSDSFHEINKIFSKLAPKGEKVNDPKIVESKELIVRVMSAFKAVFSHKEELEERGLEPFLDKPWAKEQFTNLLFFEDPWAISMFYDLLEVGDEVGLSILMRLVNDFEDLKTHVTPIFEKVFTEAMTSEPLQRSLLAFSIVTHQTGPFNEILASKMNAFKPKHGLDVKPEFVLEFADQLMSYFELFDGLKKYDFKWNQYSFHSRHSFFRLYLERQNRLLSILSNQADFKASIDRPQSKCFPQAKSVMMAYRMGHSGIVNFVADSLSAHEMSVLVLGGDHKDYDAPLNKFLDDWPHLEVLHSADDPNIWVQDYCSIHEGGIRFPSFCIPPENIKSDLVQMRETRIKERGLLRYPARASMGCFGETIRFCEHLKVFQKLFRLDPSGQSLSIQITPNEGGNCLVSRDFVFVGRDTVAYAKIALEEELRALGVLSKFEELDEGLLKEIYAQDMGLSSPDRVIFVEQPRYHLDVASMIVRDDEEKRIIWLNDSVMAVEEMAKYIEANEKTSLPLIGDQGEETYEKRLEKTREQARLFKQYEDAAALDYESAGFDVIRIGGCFENFNRNYPNNHQVNFFNFTTLRTPTSQMLILALGAPPYFEERFKELVLDHIGADVKVLFCTQEDAEKLLSSYGGINCCVKAIDRSLIPPEQ